MKTLTTYTAFFAFALVFGCKPGPEVQPAPEVAIVIQNQFGSEEMQLEKPFVSANGVELTFSKYMYYLSNVRLKREDGTWWREKESYHLVELNDSGRPTYEITLESLPAGKYTEITFGIGVDEHRNHQGEQVGALDPLNGMLWTWEVGYVFLKLEGFYGNSGNRGAMVMHVGRNECYREVILPLPAQSQSFTQGGRYEVTIQADAKKIFGGFAGATYQLELPLNNAAVQVHHGETAIKLADNYARMFTLTAITPK